jgi:hypothetical protein
MIQTSVSANVAAGGYRSEPRQDWPAVRDADIHDPASIRLISMPGPSKCARTQRSAGTSSFNGTLWP